MDDFEPRGAPLEYWFLKFHAGDLAFLVDFILRRRTDEAEVRVSIWVRGEGRVERLVSRSWSADTNTVSIGDQRLTPSGSTGATADISWELRWQPGEPLVDPRPAFLGPMHPVRHGAPPAPRRPVQRSRDGGEYARGGRCGTTDPGEVEVEASRR